tara:strand:- start:297 stop:686 length:390 start_codon:yes stop_codon:yes gene_type:complete
MEWYSWLGTGAAIGGSTVGIIWFFMHKKPELPVIKEVVAEKQIEVEAQLTDQQLLKVPCSDSYLQSKGESLCREMYCLLMTRGAVGNKAAASTCESISNSINKAMILETCANEDETKQRACIEFYDRRL